MVCLEAMCRRQLWRYVKVEGLHRSCAGVADLMVVAALNEHQSASFERLQVAVDDRLACSAFKCGGASGGTRTPTSLRIVDFESTASTVPPQRLARDASEGRSIPGASTASTQSCVHSKVSLVAGASIIQFYVD